MLKPREGEMNYEKLEDLAFYYMFLGSCLPENQYNLLKDKWNKLGGVKHMPWWQFIGENVSININPQIPVVTTYSFEPQLPTVALFSSDEDAEAYLAESVKKETEHDIENKYETKSEISKDGRYATITNIINGQEHVTQFIIGDIVTSSTAE